MTREAMIMVAPTGARKTRADHAALPLSIAETVAEAKACHAAGACALHAHVRDARGEHVLDAGLYRELIGEMRAQVPEMLVQITSEAVGRYSPVEQADCIRAVEPDMASLSLREISADFSDTGLAREFFAWCDEARVHVQHILYSPQDFEQFLDYRQRGIVPLGHRCLLFVLGRYNVGFQSEPGELDAFIGYNLRGFDWFCCAFGHREQECMLHAIAAGGHARVGFENNLYLPDGKLADGTAELVASLVAALATRGYSPMRGDSARARLGIRSA